MAVSKTALVRIQIDEGNSEAIINGVKMSLEDLAAIQEAVSASVQRSTKARAGSEAALRQERAALIKSRSELAGNSAEYAKMTVRIRQVDAELVDLTGSINASSKAMQQDLAGSAGIAGAAATELGRTISDMPFGITAVTNNISQLGNMFALLVSSAGSVKAALTAMKTALTGPVGLLIAFQAVVAGIELFAQRSKKAKEEAQDFSNTLILQGEVLRALRDDFLEGDESIENRIQLLETLAITDKNLQNILKDGTLTEEERIAKAEEYVDAIRLIEEEERNLMAAKKELDDDGRSIDEIRTEREQKQAELIALRAIAETDASASAKAGAVVQAAITEQQVNNLDELLAKYEFIETQTLAINKLRENIQVSEKKKEEDTQETIQGTIKFYQEQINALEKLRDTTATTATEVDDFNEKIRILELQIGRLADGKPIKAELTIDAPQELVLPEDLVVQVPENLEEGLKQVAQANASTWADEFFAAVETSASLERFAAQAEVVREGLSVIADVFDEQFNRELTMEQNKTTALNDELRKRLSSEQLSAEQRDAINQEIAKNDAKLVEQQNKIGKKQFQIEKAFKIAVAIADIPSMISKAYLSQLTIPSPDAPARAALAAKIAGGIGLAQVAALTRMKYEDKAIPSPNLTAQGSATPAGSAPSFNVVGASGRDQLAEAITALQQTPMKTYVVSSDVTTAQQLDRSIIQGASI